MTRASLQRVALTISAFRSDRSVIELLWRAFRCDRDPFGAVIVVESLGSGAIADAVAANGWPVQYVNSSTNLGSAGNLDLRLKLAEETGLDWCLALNHDAELDTAKAKELLDLGFSQDRIGAVYPSMRMTSAGDRLDRPRQTFITLGLTTDTELHGEAARVAWSSSNGALYRLDAIREGVNAWPELWMGYEDLAIGWELQTRGWVQLLSAKVIVDDNYEFRRLSIFGRTIHIADKPAWYAYYHTRNLTLICKRTSGRAVSSLQLVIRTLTDLLLLTFRSNRRKRAALLAKGLFDGLRGIGGKGALP